MGTKTILTLVGGISKNSLNQKLFYAVQDQAPEGLEVKRFDISTLPFFSQDIENNPPPSVRDFKNQIEQAQAILFITPEYNRSIPGVLKNAIDWGSRPHGQNAWTKKPAGVMGASMGAIGTFGAQNHLRQILSALNIRTMPQPDFYLNGSKSFDENGKLTDDRTKEFIKKYWAAFSEWI